MGSVSPVLYRLVVPARHAKIHAGVQILGSCANFHYFIWKLKNSISAPKCTITAPKIRTWSLLLSKFGFHTHRLQNGGHPRLLARLPKSVHNLIGGGGRGGVWGGVLVGAPLPAQAMRAQVASGYTAANLILVISPMSLSFSFTSLCIAAAGQLSIKMLTPWVQNTQPTLEKTQTTHMWRFLLCPSLTEPSSIE